MVFNNPIDNSIYFYILLIILFATNIILYVSDLLIPKQAAIIEEIYNSTPEFQALDQNKTLMSIYSYTENRNNFIEIINYAIAILILAIIVSNIFSFNSFESYIINAISSVIACAIILFLINYTFALIQSVIIGIEINSIAFTLFVFPSWLLERLHIVVILSLIASFIGAFLAPKQNVVMYG